MVQLPDRKTAGALRRGGRRDQSADGGLRSDQQVFEKLVEEKTFDPLFVTHCPKELVPLAKQNLEDPALVDVYELIINGVEMSPGYTELNDPDGQRQRVLEQAGDGKQKLGEEFLRAHVHRKRPRGR